MLVDAIECSRFITEKKSRELIRKLESLASRSEARELQRQVYVSDRLKNIDEKIYYNIDALHRAISKGVQIRFLYFNWALDFNRPDKIYREFRHNSEFYCVSPWALTWDNENYYLIAYDASAPEGSRIRNYRVDKMEKIQLTDKRREGAQHFRDNFSPAAYSRKMFGMFTGHEERVRLRCRKDAINILRDPLRQGADGTAGRRGALFRKRDRGAQSAVLRMGGRPERRGAHRRPAERVRSLPQAAARTARRIEKQSSAG